MKYNDDVNFRIYAILKVLLEMKTMIDRLRSYLNNNPGNSENTNAVRRFKKKLVKFVRLSSQRGMNIIWKELGNCSTNET